MRRGELHAQQQINYQPVAIAAATSISQKAEQQAYCDNERDLRTHAKRDACEA
jgi:hypothetical protein